VTIEPPVEATVGQSETDKLPIMRGNARMARGADDYFEVPLFTRLTRYLWMGCSPAEFPDEYEEFDYDIARARLTPFKTPVRCRHLVSNGKPRFDTILNLFPWGAYIVPEGVTYREVEMYDDAGIPDKDEVDELAAWVIERRGLGESGRVYVHCQAGLNRSSLISARVLMLAKRITADAAIEHIRTRRSPMCLCNEDFEKFLRGLA
jgi:hypothetical protein